MTSQPNGADWFAQKLHCLLADAKASRLLALHGFVLGALQSCTGSKPFPVFPFFVRRCWLKSRVSRTGLKHADSPSQHSAPRWAEIDDTASACAGLRHFPKSSTVSARSARVRSSWGAMVVMRGVYGIHLLRLFMLHRVTYTFSQGPALLALLKEPRFCCISNADLPACGWSGTSGT